MRPRLSNEQWLWYSVRRKGLDEELAALAGCIQGRVLEVGAGHVRRRGYFEPPIARTRSWTCVDLSSEPRPDIRANLQQLPLADRSFDTALCLEVLEYLPDPAGGVRELARVLVPDGTLILSVPFLHRVDSHEDLWRFTEHGLRSLLESSGFEVSSMRPQAFALGVAANVLKYAIYALPRGWRRRSLALALRPVLSALWASDRLLAPRHPALATFTTGYVVSAKRSAESTSEAGRRSQYSNRSANFGIWTK